jgi:hypothetical protein
MKDEKIYLDEAIYDITIMCSCTTAAVGTVSIIRIVYVGKG